MKVSIIILIYNAKKYIEPLFDSIFNQTYKNFEVLAIINGNFDGSKELIAQKFPSVKIIDPQANLWFSRGNNLGIKQSSGDLIYCVNQDVILEPNNLENLVEAFKDEKVSAATGKVLRYDFVNNKKTNIIDTTGIVMSKSGRGRDRGQNQIDQGQFDKFQIPNSKFQQIFGVSGAVAMYRRSALEKVKHKQEYFDEDFVAYWEDVDLSWRLNNVGYKNVYVPSAVSYHGRTAGSAKGGYLKIINFIKHHKQISSEVKRLNYKNHILMYIKNASFIHPLFILREIAMLGYIVLFEISTLKVIPELFRQIPKVLKKRHIYGN